MTRKDYILIAAALMNARADIASKEPERCQADLLDGVNYAAEFLGESLSRDNARFDNAKFLEACGVTA